jgi:aspartyl-tRNA(Asn)/glutamyl-tRNA(Gln) amidotransferase subunit C
MDALCQPQPVVLIVRWMKLSRAEVLHVAALARLELSEQEVESLREDLSSILTYVEKLATLDTQGVDPTSHVVAMGTPFREDEVTNRPDPERALKNAPRREGNFFVVPAIIE